MGLKNTERMDNSYLVMNSVILNRYFRITIAKLNLLYRKCCASMQDAVIGHTKRVLGCSGTNPYEEFD